MKVNGKSLIPFTFPIGINKENSHRKIGNKQQLNGSKG